MRKIFFLLVIAGLFFSWDYLPGGVRTAAETFLHQAVETGNQKLRTFSFSALKGTAGVVKDLPEDKDAQKAYLAGKVKEGVASTSSSFLNGPWSQTAVRQFDALWHTAGTLIQGAVGKFMDLLQRKS